MSFKDMQGSFVKLAEGGVDPDKIPKHYSVYYDNAFKTFQKFGHYGGVRDIPHNLWPVIIIMADMQEAINDLTDRLAVLDAELSAKQCEAPAPKKRGRSPKLQPVGA
jgi:hypothetical protein